jgi:hypothetical protein
VGLPSRHAHLIISLGPPIDVIRMPNTTQWPATFSALVSGLQDAPAMVRQGGDTHILHVFLTPLGVRGILGVASAEIASAVLNLSDIWGRRGSSVYGRNQAHRVTPRTRLGVEHAGANPRNDADRTDRS